MAENESARRAEALSRLRGVAENHLREIDQEKAQQDEDEVKRLQHLERYTKRKRGKKQTMAASNQIPTLKMRSAQDVLHRLQWDKSFDISQFKVGYLERFAGIKETPAGSWISEVTEEEWIPQHRIKYFKRVTDGGEPEIVWDRDQRIDKLFGSGASSVVGDDVRSDDGGVSLR